MGGIVECGVSTDTKDSPRRIAIEKAQEELRQEYDIREERRRELEFLVEGGNPLDFKLGHVASLSFTDQIAEQNVISEAKGSFAFDASPRGDSVESSGKPGSSSCREANTADNIMLLDGDTNNIGGEKLVKHGTKRTITPQPELSLCNDAQNSVKEVEDSGLFRLGAKSQAYARRRSKSGRDNANSMPVRSPPVTHLSSQRGHETGVVQEEKNDDHGASSIVPPKPKNINGNDMLKNASLNNQVVVEMGGVQAIHEGKQEENHEMTDNKAGMLALEISSNSVSGNSQRIGGGQMHSAAAIAESPHANPKEASSRTTLPSKHSEIFREIHSPEKVGNVCSDKSMVDAHADDMEIESSVLHPAIQTARFSENEVDITRTDATKIIDQHPGKNDIFLSMNVGQSSDEGLSNIAPVQLEGSSMLIDCSTPVQQEVSAAVKDEVEVCNNVVDKEKEMGRLATSDCNKVDKEADSDLGRNNKCSSALSGSDKLSSADVPPAPFTEDMPNPVASTNFFVHNLDNDVTKCSQNDTTLAKKECEDSIMTKKEYEDSILRRARFIEVNIKRAGEQALCNISLEKKRKSHWEFVLEEMAWMANDFMQERLWRIAAAAHVCYWIASSGRAAFDEASVHRKQKSVARILSKRIVNFWHSAETLRTTSGEIPKALQVEKSKGLEEMKLAEIDQKKNWVANPLNTRSLSGLTNLLFRVTLFGFWSTTVMCPLVFH